MNFAEETLGEICDRVGGMIRTGPFGSQLHSSDYVPDGIPVVMPKNIADGRVSTEDIARVRPDDALRLSQHVLHKGDIVYGRRGDIGRHALITRREEGWLCGTGCMRVSLGDQVVYPEYLHYYLNQQAVTTWIANQAVGATMPNLNTDILRSVPVRYPHQAIQRRIVSILSAYDDLIENNLRRIAILEEMARAIYREWFVEFRYPGHDWEEAERFSRCGVPEGWAEATVGDIAEETRQPVDPSTLDATTPYVGLAHIPRKSIALCDWGNAREAQSTKLGFQKGDILFGKIRPYFHKVAVASVDGVCSSDTIVIRPTRPEYYSLVLCCVSSDEFVAHSVQTSQGTKMPRANWDVMCALPVAVPPASLLERFSDVIGNLVDLICNLVLSTRALRSARNLLLPRLISGELDASNITIDTEEDEL